MYECFDIDEPEPYHSLSIITIIVDKGSFLVTKFISKSGNVLGTRLIFTKIKKKNKWATLLANPPLLKWSILEVYFKYTGSIFPKYIWSVLQLYLKHILNLLQVYFKYTSTCWVTEEEEEEEEVYFKSLLFRQKEYIWSTFVKLNWLYLNYT